MTIRMDEPIQLPTAQYSQSQLDLSGFSYAGQKRNVELVFADDSLDLIWILINPGEDSLFVEEFTRLYGAPTHIREDATFFLNDGVAVRNNPYEVLFLSERLKEPYRHWLDSAD